MKIGENKITYIHSSSTYFLLIVRLAQAADEFLNKNVEASTLSDLPLTESYILLLKCAGYSKNQ